MNALITGVSGFVGPYLADHLLEENHHVSGFDKYENELNGVRVYKADILDKKKVFSIVAETKPDCIFHLAAQSSVEKSFEMPDLTMRVNVEGTKNLLDAVAESKISPSILIVSSAQVYGIPKKIPIKENHPLQPNSPYAESRVRQEELAWEYQKKYDMNIVISRSFNHTGPRQQPSFVCSDFAKQIAEIEKNLKKPSINVGNTDVRRDFTDVRDVVRAYLLAVEKCKPGEAYNICSGGDVSVKKILDILLSMSDTEIKVVHDEKKKRTSDIPVLVGDNSKFRKQTNWSLKIPMEKTLEDLLSYWRDNT